MVVYVLDSGIIVYGSVVICFCYLVINIVCDGLVEIGCW